MKKRNFFRYCLFASLFAAGCLVNGFWGGMLAGIAACLFLLVILGQKVIARSAAKLDKIVADQIINQSNFKDHE